MAAVLSTSSIMSDNSQNNSDTDLSLINTEDELHTDLSTLTTSERKKLQHMTAFHEEYQQIFREKASIHTIMKWRISHMNPPIPKSICEEEIQNASLDTNEVVIEYILDGHGNKVKKLKLLLIQSEPDKEYTYHVHSDDNLPAVPEDNFMQKREVTVDSYSKTISSDESSDERTITAESDSSAASSFEETPCKWETDVKGIEAMLHQIASGLRNAADRYQTLASQISKLAPYELPQVISQLPPPPMDVHIPIRKALLVEGENKVVNYLLHEEYELTKSSWSKLQKKYNVSKSKVYAALKGKGRPGGSQY